MIGARLILAYDGMRWRKQSRWDNFSTAEHRSGHDPINPLRIERLRRRGLSYRKIGEQIAAEDGRSMPYTPHGVWHALRAYKRGDRDEDGERGDFIPATNRKPRPITLGAGIGMILFRSPKPR